MFFAGIKRTGPGWVSVAVSQKGLVCICLPGKTAKAAKDSIRKRISPEVAVLFLNHDESLVEDCLESLDGYFQGKVKNFAFVLDLKRASDFDRAVWEATAAIPYGETRSYGWMAGKIGRPGAARAVGGALGRNPLPIVIPCHRIIRSDGSLGGFGAGLDWKRRLLALEAGNQ